MIRVVVADDSPLVRGLVRQLLETDPGIRVVGEAVNGAEAVAMARRLRPDVLLMDVRMPVMDGIEATAAIMAERGVPILVLSASVLEDTSVAFRAVQAGAIDVVAKPEGVAHAQGGYAELDLVRRVKLVASVPAIRRGRRLAAPADETPRTARRDLVALGASTGGPPALAMVLGSFGPDLPVPLVAVQHIAPGFLEGFVEWLDSVVPLDVRVAEPGTLAEPGAVYFAPEGHHLRVGASGTLRVQEGPAVDGHLPSVTALFESVAESFGPRAVGVLLTGMGRDGASGLLKLRAAGARTICQDEATCVVFGMPAVAIELGAADRVVPIEGVAAEVARALEEGVAV